MSLQNRVNPHGDIVVSNSRGTMMGNRGILHNDKKELVRKSNSKGWLACRTEFNGFKRKVMCPDRYTELFFLDEVTAFSAGHRPCNDCQKDRFKEFKKSWLSANQSIYQMKSFNMSDIDEILHNERFLAGEKVTFKEIANKLPSGAFVEIDGKYFLKWFFLLLEWSFNGYVDAKEIPENQEVTVLTPKSILRCFESGYIPEVHSSALKYFNSMFAKKSLLNKMAR